MLSQKSVTTKIRKKFLEGTFNQDPDRMSSVAKFEGYFTEFHGENNGALLVLLRALLQLPTLLLLLLLLRQSLLRFFEPPLADPSMAKLRTEGSVLIVGVQDTIVPDRNIVSTTGTTPQQLLLRVLL